MIKRLCLASLAVFGLLSPVFGQETTPPACTIPADMQIDWAVLVGSLAGLLVLAIGAVIGLKLGFVLIRAAYRWLAGIASGR